MSIFWKEDEKNKVALRFAELMQEAEVNDEYLPFIRAIERAQQEVLDQSLWRPRASLQNAQGLNQKIRALGAQLLKAKTSVQAEEDRQFNRWQKDQENRGASKASQAVTIEVQSIPSNYRYDDMIQALVESVGETFKTHLRAKLNAVTNETFEEIHVAISSQLVDIEVTALSKISDVLGKVEKTKMPKVVIIGINKVQFNELEEEYGRHANLDFIDTKKSNRLKAAAMHADFVIANVTSMSHQQYNIIKQHPGLKKSNGGKDSIKDLLLEIATSKQK